MSVVLYFSSVSSNQEIKKKQQKIEMILDSKKIEYTIKDIASSESDKEEMRLIAGDPKSLPPQIANGKEYCGDYDNFLDAVECENLNEFLKL